ncbi:hypothetical protein [Streptomyces sp. NPDC018610]|uniref:hypothetical protein n=1 Tax=Streptomyces sp. NPDC018610 TaxID=3365049 RepID=UPI0037897AAD
MSGTVLLLAASPVGKGRLVDAASVLPVLAAVEPSVLSGAPTATVVELADPLEPQAVLTRLRAAAAAPGPLTVFVTGQLQLDRRQRLPHLALARTTPATVRYTALPWHWLREELRLRPDGTTTLVADLRADAESWQQVCERPLDAGPNVALYGRIAPPPVRRRVALPTYMKAVATILRSGHRPPPEQLHEQALARMAGEEGEENGPGLVLAAHRPAAQGAVGGAAPGFGPVPEQPPGPPAAPPAPGGPLPGTAVHRPKQVAASGAEPGAVVARRPVPDDGDTRAPVVAQRSAPGDPGAALVAQRPVPGDPHAAIAACVESGRHGDADALAARWEQAAVRAYGAASEDALHWGEVRADLAMFAGDAARSCRCWLTVAATRLAMGQPADAPAVEAAVDRAHHQWGRLRDPERARELGAVLAELRGRVPGRRRGALDHVRRQLRQLQTQG